MAKAPLFTHPNGPKRILFLDRDQDGAGEFREVLSELGDLTVCHDLRSLLGQIQNDRNCFALLDTATLLDSPTGLVGELIGYRGKRAMGLVTDQPIEDYIFSLRTWGLLQCQVKLSPVERDDVIHYLYMLEDPLSGFGLIRYLAHTIEMYSVTIDTVEAKNHAIERVMNHFATCGFEVHELYDVRLILEEICNNALFHAFHTASGEEKYDIQNFKRLDPGETVRIEYGSDARKVGFSVTDNSGTLPISTILSKLERQLNREGIFDESGRGLYLSRMLATKLVINIEHEKRTQIIALFDEHRKSDRPKPFFINHIGPDTFDDWRLDPDFD